MTPRFITSQLDQRKLTMPWYAIARIHPGRREHIYGRVHEMTCTCKACSKEAA